MKLNLKILIVAAILVAVGILGGVALKKDTNDNPTEKSLGATGSGFFVDTEWGVASSTTQESGLISINKEIVASSTAKDVIYVAGGATTTLEIVTGGVSDLRLNLTANSSSTVADIAILKQIVGFGTSTFDYFDETQVTSESITGNNIFWRIATTSVRDYAQISIPLTNIIAPKMRFVFGTTQPIDLSVEVMKMIPQ